MRKLTVPAVLLSTRCLLVSSVAAAEKCKRISARIEPTEWLGQCDYEGATFDYCIDASIRGNLPGTWRWMSRVVDGLDAGWELTVPDGAVTATGWDFWALFSVSVFETRKGTIITQGNDIDHLGAYFAYGALATTHFVVGGTGKYEGASGWLGFVGTEFEGGILRGMICTPGR